MDELVAFAFDCWPEVNRLPLYSTLQLRKRIGPRAMPYLEPFMVSAFAHKAHGWLRRQVVEIPGGLSGPRQALVATPEEFFQFRAKDLRIEVAVESLARCARGLQPRWLGVEKAR